MSAKNSISVQEKIAVMYLLNAISRADEKVEQEELDYLTFYTQEHHLVFDDEVFKQQKFDQLCADIKSETAKKFAIEEVIKLALCDGNYHQAERRGAMFLADKLGLEEAEFLSIEQTTIEQI